MPRYLGLGTLVVERELRDALTRVPIALVLVRSVQ